MSDLWGLDPQDRRISGHEPLAVLQEDQVNSGEIQRRSSNDSECSISLFPYADRKCGISPYFLTPKEIDERQCRSSSDYDRSQSRMSFASDRRSSHLSTDFDRRNSSLSERRSSGYTSDCSDRKDIFLEEEYHYFTRSPSINESSQFQEVHHELGIPQIGINESKDVVLTETCKPGMKNVPDWLKSLRLHKYTNLIMSMGYQEMIDLTEDKLLEMKVTKGAARKIANSIQKLKERLQTLQDINEIIETPYPDMKKVLDEMEFILKSPVNLGDVTSDDKDSDHNDGKILIQKIMITLQCICSHLLLSLKTDPKHCKEF